VLSAYTHIWNPIGFPVLRPDEGAYMRRAMHVLEGLGPQDPASRFDHSQDSTSSYDHPYFGQLFLGGILKLIGYPGSIINPSSFSSSSTISSSSPNSIQHSIEMLYLVPRMLMGMLAVIDTFLIYKICEHRYNRSVAFIASILFAVMPMTWILRLIVLDSIQLPFLLCSILFATYYPIKKSNFAKSNIENSDNTDATYRKQFMLILLSGIFLGLAIFTKLPAITVIPMVAFLIYTNNSKKNNDKNNNLKKVGLWFIPVILIPLIWPVYSISVGHFNEWLNGVMWQATERHGGKTLPDIIISFFRIDPLLLVLGTAGIVISALATAATSPKTKDFLFLVLWSSPYLLLIYFVGWAIIFYLIPLLPIFCIAAAWLLEYLVNRIASSDKIRIAKKKNTEQQEDVLIQQKLFLASSSSLSPLSFAIILVTAIFVIFGLLTSSILITTNISLSQFEAAAFVGYDIQHNSYASSSSNNNNNNNSSNKSANGGGDDDITIISSPAYSWIFNYVFHESHVFSHDRDTQPIETKKILLIVDGTYKRVLSKVEGEDEKQVTRLEKLYNSTDTIATYDDDTTRYVHNEYNNYPYASMNENRIGGGGIEVKANY
jgi:hypothetical protein